MDPNLLRMNGMMESMLAAQEIDRAAVLANCDAMYDRFDTDNNGVIDQDEMEAALAEWTTDQMIAINDKALAEGRPIMLQDEITEQVEAAKEAVPGLLSSVGKGEVRTRGRQGEGAL